MKINNNIERAFIKSFEDLMGVDEVGFSFAGCVWTDYAISLLGDDHHEYDSLDLMLEKSEARFNKYIKDEKGYSTLIKQKIFRIELKATKLLEELK